MTDRRQKQWKKREYYDNPTNHWFSVFKGVFFAGLALSLLNWGVYLVL